MCALSFVLWSMYSKQLFNCSSSSHNQNQSKWASSANRRNFFDILNFNQRKQMHNPLLWLARSVSIFTHRLHICMTHCTYLVLVSLGDRGFLDWKCWYIGEMIHCVYRMSTLVLLISAHQGWEEGVFQRVWHHW